MQAMSHKTRSKMDKRKIRDGLRLVSAWLFCWLYLPHMLCYAFGRGRENIKADVARMSSKMFVKCGGAVNLLYLLHNNRYFRSLFYFRIGPVASLLIGWWRPGDRYFQLSQRMTVGPGMLIAHPMSTILNAERIGANFSCVHLTTLGDAGGRRPVIGDNVTLGVAVSIVGGVSVGDNVTIGAGSVVVKDIPSDCIAAGNPARVIKWKNK